MRKYNVVEVAFNMVTCATATKVVASGLDADKATAKARSLNDGGSEGGEVVKAYRAEVATA